MGALSDAGGAKEGQAGKVGAHLADGEGPKSLPVKMGLDDANKNEPIDKDQTEYPASQRN